MILLLWEEGSVLPFPSDRKAILRPTDCCLESSELGPVSGHLSCNNLVE